MKADCRLHHNADGKGARCLRVPFARPCYASFGLERISIWMLNGVCTKIYIEVWPIEMTWGWLLNIEDFTYWSVLEPREVGVRKEILCII
jgi:hypothetical protein